MGYELNTNAATASTLRMKGDSLYYIRKFLKTVNTDKKRIVSIANIEKDLKEIGIKSMMIDKKDYRVIVDGQGINSVLYRNGLVEGPDNLFYPYGFNSPVRMSLGASQGKWIRMGKNLLENIKTKWIENKKKCSKLIWNQFIYSLKEYEREEILNLSTVGYNIPDFDRTAPIRSFLKTYQFNEIFREKQFSAYTDYSNWMVFLSNNAIQIYSWPGYYDLNASMKFFCLFKIGKETLGNLMNFFNTKDPELLRIKVEPRILFKKDVGLKKERIELLNKIQEINEREIKIKTKKTNRE